MAEDVKSIHELCDRIFARKKCAKCPLLESSCTKHSFLQIATLPRLKDRKKAFIEYGESLGITVKKVKPKTTVIEKAIATDKEFMLLLKGI